MDTNLSTDLASGDQLMLTASPSSPSTPSYLDLDRQEPSALQTSGECASEDMDPLFASPLKKMRTKDGDLNRFVNSKDIYCWICHKEKINISCSLCVRSFHMKCLPGNTLFSGQEGLTSANSDNNRWVCVECNAISKAEEAKTRSEALRSLTPDEFCELLKYALSTIKQTADITFHHPVSEQHFPDYKYCIIHPMDFSTIDKNIRAKMYGCTESLLADVKWILHNCHIFNNHNHPLTINAKYFLKVAKNEMGEIEVCPNCFKNFYTCHEWFIQPCAKPHSLVWARLKGHPFWPAKVVRIDRDKNEVDARFFGAHDRAWVPVDSCYEISEYYCWNKPAKGQKNKFEAAMAELQSHINKIQAMFPNKFKYAPSKTLFNQKMFICGDSDDDDSDDKSDKLLIIEEDIATNEALEPKKEENANNVSLQDEKSFSNNTSSVRITEDDLSFSSASRGQDNDKSDVRNTSESFPKFVVTPPPKKPKMKIGKGFKPNSNSAKNASKSTVSSFKKDSKESKYTTDELCSKKRSEFESLMHQEQIREIKHNSNLTISEMRRVCATDKEKAIKELEEKHRKELEAVKRKQWCAFCLNESIYFCCWNTSYCSYNCQSKHWPKHMSECQQQQQQQQKMTPPKTQSQIMNAN